jgi:PAS domain S-box-containing protein
LRRAISAKPEKLGITYHLGHAALSYERLPAPLKALVDQLWAVHSNSTTTPPPSRKTCLQDAHAAGAEAEGLISSRPCISERRVAEEEGRGDTVRGISAELRQLFERAPGLAVVLRGPDHVFEYANPGYLQLMGWRDLEGLPLREAVPELAGQGFLELLDEVYRTGRPYEGRAIPILLPSAPGAPLEEGYFDFVYQPIVGPSGEVEGIFAQGSDITERVRAQERLRASEARFADIFTQATVGIAQTDLTGRFVLVNDRQCEILGRTREDLMSRTMQEVTHPDDLPGNKLLFQKLIETGEPFVIEKRYVQPDGRHVWVSNNVALQRDGEGRPQYVTAVVVDITEAKLAAARQRLLINELNHRVKNTLATVQSLAAQTLRTGDPKANQAAFVERLMALSRAHDVLTQEQWSGADLAAVLEAALKPFGGEQLERFRVSGPAVRLAPTQALAFSMAFHELATNAVKYGALSGAAGLVAITWSVEPGGGAAPDRLLLTWRESGGPPVSPPAREGFGSRLLKGLAQELGGSVRSLYAAGGVTWTIEGRPSATVTDGPPGSIAPGLAGGAA